MLKNPSKKERRQANILHVLRIDPSKRVKELTKHLKVSPETVRRDLADLHNKGRIQRTYGGAVRTPVSEPALAERLKLFIIERERIAKSTVDLLSNVTSLFVGGGATTLHFARTLKNAKRQITILTASCEIALELASNPILDVILLPGTVNANEGLVHGPETLRFLSNYNVEVAVVGASAINDSCLSEALPDAADVYDAMIKQSKHTIVVADHSKFDKRSLKSVLEWNEQTTLVTDKHPPENLKKSLARKKVRLIIAEQE